MAETTQARSKIHFSGRSQKIGDFTLASNAMKRTWEHVLVNGTGEEQCDLMAHAALTLTGAAVTVNLWGFFDVFAVSYKKMVTLRIGVILNTGASGAGDVTIGVTAGGDELPWQITNNGIEVLHPGDSLILQSPTAGWPLVSGRVRMDFDCSGGDATCEYFFAGVEEIG